METPPESPDEELHPTESFLRQLDEEQPFLVVQDLKEEGLRGLTLLHGLSLVQYLLHLPCVADLDFAPFPLLIFLLEKLLRDLRRRECSPIPVFFRNEQEPLCSYQRSVLWLVQRHLEYLAATVALDLRPRVFGKVTDAEWLEFQVASSPSIAFALLPEKEFSEPLAICVDSFILSCLNADCSVAPLNEVEFHASTILGPLLTSLDVPTNVQTELRMECAAISAPEVRFSVAAPVSTSQCVLEALRGIARAHQGNELVQVQCRIALLSFLLQEQLSLYQRSLPYVELTEESQKHARFCELLFEELWPHLRVAKLPQGAILDLFDVNLFRHTLFQLCAAYPTSGSLSSLLRLSSSAVALCESQWASLKLNAIWDLLLENGTLASIRSSLRLRSLCEVTTTSPTAHVRVCDSCNSASKTETALPVRELASWEDDNFDLPAVAPPLSSVPTFASPNDLLFPLHSALIGSVLKQPMPHLREDHKLVKDAFASAKAFEELYHWHSVRPLALPPWKQKKNKRLEQKKLELCKRLQKYCESLGGIRQQRIIGAQQVANTKKSAKGTDLANEGRAKMLKAESERAESACSDYLMAIAEPTCHDVLTRAKNLLRFIQDSRVIKIRALKALLEIVKHRASYDHREDREAMCFRIERVIEKLIPRALGEESSASLGVKSQLLHCGDTMQWREPLQDPETMDNDFHKYGFVPEPWQRRMVAAIDARKSVLVCAPTSSGKTFISFYVIESILTEDDNAVIAFVLPTKALVNQVYAEIQVGFKRTGKHSTLVGIFTADQRLNEGNCSVLVTVPQALEILLLSPASMPWLKRMRYLILDEAHGITDREGGSVWEHILVLTHCPFLALSATIGNVDNFLGWLRSIKKSTVELIQHAERSTYQRLSMYDSGHKSLLEINAIALATTQDLKAGLSAEWRLLPPQTYKLFVSLAQAFKVTPAADALAASLAVLSVLKRYAVLASMCIACKESVSPLTRLNSLLFDTTKDAMPLADLTELLQSPQFALISPSPLTVLSHMSPDAFFSGQAEITRNDVALYDNLLRRFCEAAAQDAHLQSTFKQLNEPLINAASITEGNFILEIRSLFATLRSKSLLPAIVFLFDRQRCDELCQALGKTLPFPERLDLEILASTERLTSCGKYESWWYWQIACLKRGIAVHHSSCNDEYKMEVERLFRMKRLSVVFATGTLAQGIHMPCRTVVLAGNSPYLTAVMVRQIAGRAGRRGFDVTGNVVFYGLNFATIRRLLLSPLPQVFGSLPITPTYVLRLLLLADGKTDTPAADAVLRQLRQPLFAFGEKKEAFQSQMQHHLRFSLEYLLQEAHLDAKGIPLQWTGMLTHLHYEEPSNFVLVRWVKEGLLHALVESNADATTVQRKLVHVLSSIFSIRKLRRVTTHAPQISRVLLEPLPEEFAKSVEKHNREVKAMYEAYIRQYIIATQLAHKEERLPLSSCALTILQNEFSWENEPLLKALQGRVFRTLCRSQFVALAGRTDVFDDTQEFVDTARSELLLDSSMLPTLHISSTLNAYLLDFFKHGQQATIATQNRVPRNEFTKLADGFWRIIKKVHTALLERANNENEVLVAAMKGLRQAFQDKLHPDWKWKNKKRELNTSDL